MNASAISIEHKEKRSYIEVTIWHDYFVKFKNGHHVGHKKSIIKIKKLTKKEIIKEAKKNL